MWQEHKKSKRLTRTSTIVREEEISSPLFTVRDKENQEKKKEQGKETGKEKEKEGGIRSLASEWLPSKVAIGNITIYSSDKGKKATEEKGQDKGQEKGKEQEKGEEKDEKHQIRFRKRFNLPNETYLTCTYCHPFLFSVFLFFFFPLFLKDS